MNAVDTNVLVYSRDRHEPVKQAKAQALLAQLMTGSTKTITLWQALVEFVQRLRRWRDAGEITDADYSLHTSGYRGMFRVVMPTEAVLDLALDLSSRYSLSHWDSLMLGACRDAGVTTLYTEDMGSPRTIDGIQLVNPFL